jgi:hypothetical protein
VKTGEIYGRMTVQYGDNCMSQRKVYERVERFGGGGWRSVDDDDDARSGGSLTVTCVEVKERIDQRIRDNRRMKIHYVAS